MKRTIKYKRIDLFCYETVETWLHQQLAAGIRLTANRGRVYEFCQCRSKQYRYIAVPDCREYRAPFDHLPWHNHFSHPAFEAKLREKAIRFQAIDGANASTIYCLKDVDEETYGQLLADREYSVLCKMKSERAMLLVLGIAMMGLSAGILLGIGVSTPTLLGVMGLVLCIYGMICGRYDRVYRKKRTLCEQMGAKQPETAEQKR